MQVLCDIPRPELLARIKVNEWGIVENVVRDLPPSPLFGIPLGLTSPANPKGPPWSLWLGILRIYPLCRLTMSEFTVYGL